MSFLIVLALTVVIYLYSYFMLFLGYIHLVRKQPEKKRAFNIPGGNKDKIAVATVGLLTSVVAFVVSFFPPTGLAGGEANEVYASLLVVRFLTVLATPFLIYALRDKHRKFVNLNLASVNVDDAPKGHFLFIHVPVLFIILLLVEKRCTKA